MNSESNWRNSAERELALSRELEFREERGELERSLYHFLKSAWKYIDPSPWSDGWPIEAVAEHLQAVIDGDIKRLLINIPPRMGKSSICSVALPAWTWAQEFESPTSGPGVQFLAASYAQQLVLRDSVKCRRLIESPWYQRYWGKRFRITGDQNAKHRFANNRGGERLITSVGSAVTGEGGSCFPAGTLVSTPIGDRSIEALCAGDEVFAFDCLLEKVVKSRVVATAQRYSRDIIEIHSLSGHSIRCTGDHPIFSAGSGYIRANGLGTQDGLLVLDAQAKCPVDQNASTHMRLVRKGHGKAPVPCPQGAEAGESGRLLQHGVQFGAQSGQGDKAMRDMRKPSHGSSQGILLPSLPSGVEGEKEIRTSIGQAHQEMRGMWYALSEQWRFLFKRMRQQRSFEAYAGLSQLEVYENRPLLKPISADARGDLGAGRFPLRCVRSCGDASEVGEGLSHEHSNSSHRRGFQKQPSEQSDFSMSELSQDAPPWVFSHFSHAQRHGDEEVCVYDIQVEGQSNFFANGILVHNCIIVDDPNAANEAFSEANIQSTIDWWDGTMSTRLNDPKTGAFIVIQQRLAEDDLTGHILSKDSGEWTHLVLPMHYEPERSFVTGIGWKDPRTEPGELLWPERFGAPEVRALEVSLGKFKAAGQLEQRPEPPGGGIIKREWWQTWEDTAFPRMDYVIAYCDTAYTEKTINDPSAMTVWGVFSQDPVAMASRVLGPNGAVSWNERSYSEMIPKVMLMHAWQDRLEFHELVEKVQKTASKFKCDNVLIENKASGISVAQELRRVYGHENFSVQLNDPKSQDKISRLYSVQHLFSEGLIYAPDRQWADMVITQVGQFPAAKHDDLVDTVSGALRHLRDIGLLTRSIEKIAEIEASKVYTGKPPAPLYPS